MSVSMLLLLIGIGIVSGVLAGMLGIGGAIIMVPALVFILGFNQHMAQGTSLAVMLPPIGLIAAYNYWKAGQVNLKFALIIAGAFIIGSYFGSKYSLSLPEAVVKKIFGGLLLLIAVKMLMGR